RRRNPLSFLFSKQRRHSIPRKAMKKAHIPTGIFGVPLEYAAECGSVTSTGIFVPDPVHRCMDEVIRRGLSVEGIFRLSGAASDVDQLCQQFDTPPAYGKCLDLTKYDIHTIVGVMKKYLRCLPEPVIPTAFHHQFLQAAMDIEHIASLAAKMPKVHFDLLFTMIELCAHIQRHQHVNLMNAEALAVVLAPVCTGLDQSLRDVLTIKSPTIINEIVQSNQRWTDLWRAMIEAHDTLLTL
ncbi:Rho GTPase activation protein, partial [Dichotomocladium elegans]